MDAPRALVFWPLVKGNEALGTRLVQNKIISGDLEWYFITIFSPRHPFFLNSTAVTKTNFHNVKYEIFNMTWAWDKEKSVSVAGIDSMTSPNTGPSLYPLSYENSWSSSAEWCKCRHRVTGDGGKRGSLCKIPHQDGRHPGETIFFPLLPGVACTLCVTVKMAGKIYV